MAEEQNLDFGINLKVDLPSWQKSWGAVQKKIQATIDECEFTIRLKMPLDKELHALKTLREEIEAIQRLQKEINMKPLTAFQAGKLAEMPIVAAAKEREKWAAKSAVTEQQLRTEMERTQAARNRNAQSLIRLNRETEKSVNITQRHTRSFMTQSGVLNGLRQCLNSYVSLLGAYRLISNIKNITSEFELQRVSLAAITRDAAFAESIFSKIKQTSIKSPFRTKELVTYTKQLSAFRIENENLYEAMNMLADVSAGLGVSMDRLILAYGQVKAASVLRGTELRQFTEAGIPLVDELAKKFSRLRGEVVSTGEVFQLISTRQVPFKMIDEILKEMTEEGGRFYQMQKKQSESLYGVYENLKDNIQLSFDKIGQSQRGALMGIGKGFTSLAKNLDVALAALSPLVYGFAAYKLGLMLANRETKRLGLSNVLLARAESAVSREMGIGNQVLRGHYRLMTAARVSHNMYAVSLIKAATATNIFEAAFYRLKAAFLLNPVTIAFSALTVAIVGAVTAWNRHINTLRSSEAAIADVQKKVDGIRESVEQDFNFAAYKTLKKNLEEQDTLLESIGMDYAYFKKIYPELAEKYKDEAGLAEAANSAYEKKKRLLKEVKDTYPEYFSYLDEEKANVKDLENGYARLSNAMREVEIQRIKAEKAKAIAAKEELEKGRTVMAWTGGTVPVTDKALHVDPTKKDRAMIEGYGKRITQFDEQIGSLEKSMADFAKTVHTYWRQQFKDLVENMEESKLAELQFAESIDKTQKIWREAKENVKYYDDAIKELSRSTSDDNEVEAQIKDFKKLREEQQKIIDGAATYAQKFNFALSETKKGTDSQKELLEELRKALKSELSLINEIKQRYDNLRKSTSDADARAKTIDIYKSLMPDTADILSENKYKEKLEELAERAESYGDKETAIKIRLKIQDIDMLAIQEKLKQQLNDMAERLSKTKEATDFFNNILGATGDVDVSKKLTLSITGIDVSTGENVRQLLAQQLSESLREGLTYLQTSSADFGFDISPENISTWKDTAKAVDKIIGLLNKSGKNLEIGKIIKRNFDDLLNYNQKSVLEIYKIIAKYSDSDEKIAALKAKFQENIKDINRPPELDDAAWAAYKTALETEYNESVASIRLEDLKKQFAEQFADLELVTDSMLDNIITTLTNWLKSPEGLKASATDIKTTIDSINKATEIKSKRSPFDAWLKSYDAFKKARKSGDAEKIELSWRKLKKETERAASALQTVVGSVSNLIDTVTELSEAFGITFSEDTKAAIDAVKTGLEMTVPVLSLIVAIIFLMDEEVQKLMIKLWPLLAIAAALGLIVGLVKYFSGAKERKEKKAQDELNKSLERLKESYERLERVQRDLAGVDWIDIQREKIHNLTRQANDFTSLYEHEKKKGKKKNEEDMKDYLKKAEEAKQEAEDLQRETIEEMTGTDLISTAKDFAHAWLEAYISFGNTMEALREKFKDTMKELAANMVITKIVQRWLKNTGLFDKIDEIMNLRSPAEIVSGIIEVWDKFEQSLPELNNILEPIMERLSFLRGQKEDSGLTGIAKAVSQASEESILTLAGYANSLLYNQVFIKEDVAAIRSILQQKEFSFNTGKQDETMSLNVGELVVLQRLSIGYLEAIRDNTAETTTQIRELNEKVDSVISVPGVTSRRVLNTRLNN